jgi:hypothetical protein
MVKKLISGGQTGADISIVRVGRNLNIPIGGIVPKGWVTETGPDLSLEGFGFVQSDTVDYASRTKRNIDDSDATLIFATDPESDGTRLTVDHALAIGKPHLLVDPFEPDAIAAVRNWLDTVRPAILNVAGNRESKSPGISEAAEHLLLATLGQVEDPQWPKAATR